MLLFSPHLSGACLRLPPSSSAWWTGGTPRSRAAVQELSGPRTSCQGIAQVTLSRTSAGMTGQIAFTQMGRGGGTTESGALPSCSQCPPFARGVCWSRQGHTSSPSLWSVCSCGSSRFGATSSSGSLLVEPQPPWLGCLCWYLWSSWLLLYRGPSESTEKRVQSLLSCRLGACVKRVHWGVWVS